MHSRKSQKQAYYEYDTIAASRFDCKNPFNSPSRFSVPQSEDFFPRLPLHFGSVLFFDTKMMRTPRTRRGRGATNANGRREQRNQTFLPLRQIDYHNCIYLERSHRSRTRFISLHLLTQRKPLLFRKDIAYPSPSRRVVIPSHQHLLQPIFNVP